MTEFEVVIGLEIHAQLATSTKIFCACPVELPAVEDSLLHSQTNRNTCPICAGHPGTLPVMNARAFEMAARAGLAMECTVNPRSVFARKNYFYPDLPKGYQISQFDKPICTDGKLTIEFGDDKTPQVKTVRIQRIHLEEDAGKNIHEAGYSVVDLNRAGVPLIEIVSEPDMRSPQEASAYMRAVHAIVTAIGVCNGNMQEGNFRCDANVSVRPRGDAKLGTRAEIKNVNSFKFIERAIEYEAARQIEIVKSGGRVIQETRGFDSAVGKTYTLRSKEEAHDYRYFPDPDLIPLQLAAARISELKASLPELPHQKRDRYRTQFGLSSYDAAVLTQSTEMSGFFDRTVTALGADGASGAKIAANLLTGEVSRLVNETGVGLNSARLTPESLAELVRLQKGAAISSTGAKQVLGIVWASGEAVSTVVDREGLRQVSDTGAIEKIVEAVVAQFPAQCDEVRAGKDKVIGFLVGQIMKQAKGTQSAVNPALAQEILRKKLGV